MSILFYEVLLFLLLPSYLFYSSISFTFIYVVDLFTYFMLLTNYNYFNQAFIEFPYYFLCRLLYFYCSCFILFYFNLLYFILFL